MCSTWELVSINDMGSVECQHPASTGQRVGQDPAHLVEQRRQVQAGVLEQATHTLVRAGTRGSGSPFDGPTRHLKTELNPRKVA